MFDAALHGIEALTEVQLCVLPRRQVWGLFGKMPAIAFDVTMQLTAIIFDSVKQLPGKPALRK
jgi:hypothetical protein